MVLNITETRLRRQRRCVINIFSLIAFVSLNLNLNGAESKPFTALLNLRSHSDDRDNLRQAPSYDDFNFSYELHNSKPLNKQLQANHKPATGTTLTSTNNNHEQQRLQQQQQQLHQLQQRDSYLDGYEHGRTSTHLSYFQQKQQQPQITQHAPQPPPLQPQGPMLNGSNNLNGTKLSRGALRKALLSLQNPYLLGGDILLRMGRRKGGRHMIKYERSALVSPVILWPNGVIYYELDPSVEHLIDLIGAVMQRFHDETCIRFVPRKHNEPDFLRIESVQGCFSYIGRIGGEQTLSLGSGCEYKGTIAHELLHAVGFFHHQNRSDRDDHLEILWDNIARGKTDQFTKMAPNENILLNEFDYNSVMLYGPHTFGKTLDKVTMKPKQDGVILLEVVEKQGLSLLDIDSVNKLYKCKLSD